MVYELFNQFESALVGTFGSLFMVAMLITIFFVVVLMIIGLDFRYALLLDALVFVGFAEQGWFPQWLLALAWIVVIGYGAYLAWSIITERY